MTEVVQISTMSVAILSIIVSLYVVKRDRKNRKFDMLYKSYNRLINAHKEANNSRSEEGLGLFANIEDDEINIKSPRSSNRIDSELEFACYLVCKKQIDLKVFFDLFKGWLSARGILWLETSEYKAYNHPYTWLVIKKCYDKKYLPIKTNRDAIKIKQIIDSSLKTR